LTIRRERTQLRAARWVLAALICFEVVAMSVSSQDLFVRRNSGEIHPFAPRLHFLTGKTLARLHDGAAVPFDFRFTIASGSKTNVVARAFERFTVSYDVWQEKFSVVRLHDFRRSPLSLSANAAEAWCEDNIALPAKTLPEGRELWASLEIRSVEQKAALLGNDSGISITTLIELFSRPPHAEQDRWTLESKSFHLPEGTP
jgi:hypothetical protein